MDKDHIRRDLRILHAQWMALSRAKFDASRKSRNHLDAAILVAEHRSYESCAEEIKQLLEDEVGIIP